MQTNITPEELEYIVKTLSKHGTLGDEYVYKLFPQLDQNTYDAAALVNAGLPKLVYDGKRSKAAILAEATVSGGPLEVERYLAGAKENDDWTNMIVQGDNLQFLKTCYRNEDPLIKDKVKGKVKLIYIDPPFATESDFGGKDGQYSYSDKRARAEFLEGLRERLIYLRELLADDGSIYVHLDQKMSHYVKILMDEIFGKDNFRNEIVWTYNGKGLANAKKGYVKYFANIQFYSSSQSTQLSNKIDKLSESVIKRFGKYLNEFNQITFGALIKGNEKSEIEKSRKRFIKEFGREPEEDDIASDFNKGIFLKDFWDDIPIVRENKKYIEYQNYPTQKPEALLERIINASSDKDDLIIDCFGGSGTTAAVADKLERRWITCDFGKHAIYTMQKRMLRIGESRKLGKDVKAGEKYGGGPKPFLVASVGAYDFTKVMNLHEHKDAYVTFVLALHSLERGENMEKKYSLPNIFSEKDGDPVEVYPIWIEDYLKQIRIDEKYLKGIIDASGGKLKGDYYIITPETCANVGDTTMKNGSGGEVEFHILSFPYKLLEEMSRSFVIEEQPSSEGSVNRLINSKAFYFNEPVEIDVVRTEKGLRITRFDSQILDKDKKLFEGLTGLAMLLIDDDHHPDAPFDMDHTVYNDQIGEGGEMEVPDLKGPIAVIAIDKHGNESKPCIIP